MTRYLIRDHDHVYWRARGAGLTPDREQAYRFTREQVAAIIKDYPGNWFKEQKVLIPVGGSE